jgi:hypothetical protein
MYKTPEDRLPARYARSKRKSQAGMASPLCHATSSKKPLFPTEINLIVERYLAASWRRHYLAGAALSTGKVSADFLLPFFLQARNAWIAP